MMNWIAVADRLPESGRVLVYSPDPTAYVGSIMLFRLMDAQFVRISTEVTHWCVPTAPTN